MGDQFGEKVFDVEDLQRSLEEQGPYQNVLLQELDVANTLLAEMKRSLRELQLGFNGELTMSDGMETLMMALFMDNVPPTWTKRAWPSLRNLATWLTNFNQRLNQLEEWYNMPGDCLKVTWLSGMVNPQVRLAPPSFADASSHLSAEPNLTTRK